MSKKSHYHLGTSQNFFAKFACHVSKASGHPAAFAMAALMIVVWAVTGPIFDFSDTWQLVINTSTTIITFLMVFLIQSTQNRDSEAMQIKLDEIIRSLDGAQNALLDLEELDVSDLEKLRAGYLALARKARKESKLGK